MNEVAPQPAPVLARGRPHRRPPAGRARGFDAGPRPQRRELAAHRRPPSPPPSSSASRLGAQSAGLFEGMLALDPLGIFFKLHPDRRLAAGGGRLPVRRLARAEGAGPGRVLRADAGGDALEPPPGRRQRPRHAVPGPGDGLDHLVRDGRLPEGRPAQQRGLAEVHPLRRHLHRRDALRALAPLRDDGQHEPARDPPGARLRPHRRQPPHRLRHRPARLRRASASRRRRCRSTSGAPTCTRARPRR